MKRERGRPKKHGADPVEQYALDVLAGRIVAGPWVRKACERHLRDLKERDRRGLVWRWDLAADVVDFFARCLRHGEGEHVGKPFVMLPWEVFITGQLYGWRQRTNGARRFRTAYIEEAKGAGKSPYVAGLAIYEIARGHVEGAEIFSAATGRDQAKIVFKRADLMVNKSPALKKRIIITRENMACPATGSFFRPVSREAGSLEGHNVHLAIVDEVHVHKNADVCDTMQDGTKGRPDALVIEITNTGAGTHNVCYDHRKYSEQILDGMLDNDAWFAFVCGLDAEDDWRDPKVWPKANPSLGVTVSEAFLAEQVRKAEGMPARQRRVKRLNFCIWDDAGPERAIEPEVWKACGLSVDRDALRGREAWGGLDLSAVHDLTSFVLVFPRDDRKVDVLPWFWLPAEGLAEKARRDQVPYLEWRDMGALEVTPGPTIDDWYVARRIEQICSEFDVRGIGYDRWGMEKFLGTVRAVEADIPEDRLIAFGQGYQSMGPAINGLEKALVEKRLRHGMHPVLTMCAGFAVADQDPAGNRKWAKNKAQHRIDGIVALTMAIGVMLDRQAMPRPAYQIYVLGGHHA